MLINKQNRNLFYNLAMICPTIFIFYFLNFQDMFNEIIININNKFYSFILQVSCLFNT